MGMGLHGETQEQIQNIQDDAHAETGNDGGQANIGNRKTRAAIWQHFLEGPRRPDKSYTATCNYCGHVYIMGNQKGTASMKNHIKRGCKRIPQEIRVKPLAFQRLLQQTTNNEGESKLVSWVFDQVKCRDSFAKMVIAHEYPFNCASHHFLKVFLSDLQPSFHLPTRNTIRNDCLRIYENERFLLYDVFSKFNCKASFTSDLWTSKSGDRGFMALTCHYIDDKWVLRKRIISFTPLPSPHTGSHISSVIYEKLINWNLDKKIFSLVLDNASANDACIRELLKTPLKNSLPVNGEVFHLRCGCHVLNLIVQDGLGCLTGEINKIRDAMKYIRHSQARMERFELARTQSHAPSSKPRWDVHTRWNSTYIMLQLALELREAINRFATLDTSFTYCPNEEDWNKVEALTVCLKAFYDATQKFSGIKYPTLNIFFPDYCEVFLSIKKMENSPYPFIVTMGKEMFKKWDKYWKCGNVLLAIACALDPRCKLHVVKYYFRMMDPEGCNNFIANLKACLNELFKEYAEAHSKEAQASSSTPIRASSASSSIITDTRAGLRDYLSAKKSTEPTRSELEEYLSEPVDETSVDEDYDILAWWKLKAAKYPIMSRLTRDILAVPVSTVASESAFSTAGRTLSLVRSSLNDESLQALICAQDWLRASVTENGLSFGDSMWSVDEPLDDDSIC